MHKFDMGLTIKTGLLMVRHNWRELLRMNAWSFVALLVLFFIIFGAQSVFLLNTDLSRLEPGQSAPVSGAHFALMMIVVLFMFIPLAAMMMNWQRFLITGDVRVQDSIDEGGVPISGRTHWWRLFGRYLLSQVQVYSLLLLLWGLTIGPIFMGVNTFPTFYGFLVFGYFIGLILLIPFISRASLVFPNVAANLPDMSFTQAIALGKGNGWKIYFTMFVSMFALQLIFMAVMIVVLIASTLLSLVLGAFGAFIPMIVMIILYPMMMIAWPSIMAGAPALVLLQLKPDLNDRWLQLTEGAIPEEGDDTIKREMQYGRRKGQ